MKRVRSFRIHWIIRHLIRFRASTCQSKTWTTSISANCSERIQEEAWLGYKTWGTRASWTLGCSAWVIRWNLPSTSCLIFTRLILTLIIRLDLVVGLQRRMRVCSRICGSEATGGRHHMIWSGCWESESRGLADMASRILANCWILSLTWSMKISTASRRSLMLKCLIATVDPMKNSVESVGKASSPEIKAS